MYVCNTNMDTCMHTEHKNLAHPIHFSRSEAHFHHHQHALPLRRSLHRRMRGLVLSLGARRGLPIDKEGELKRRDYAMEGEGFLFLEGWGGHCV